MQLGSHRPSSRMTPIVPAMILILMVVMGAAQTVFAESESANLAAQAKQLFGQLPDQASNPANPITASKVELGRMLYSDPRLSKSQEISCNSCHQLDRYGVDNLPTSPGHRGQLGGRNSPTVFNAALHLSQFWDGRDPDVEAQAKGPVLNPIEMALPSAAAADAVLASIPGYAPLFRAAFPDHPSPVSFDNFALAVAAFERTLLTPGPLDAFMGGDLGALTKEQQQGLETFIETGCITCHLGPAIGGGLYRKLGQAHPYDTNDEGRMEVTGKPEDRHVFKVPSLRNIAKTGPYFHDGSIETLPRAIRLMAYHQLGRELSDEQIEQIEAFLGALTGEIDAALLTPPKLPESGPDTPAPDPS